MTTTLDTNAAVYALHLPQATSPEDFRPFLPGVSFTTEPSSCGRGLIARFNAPQDINLRTRINCLLRLPLFA